LMTNILPDAYAVLLPAIADLRLTDDLKAYFLGGGRSLLLGETREEYVARKMSEARMDHETGDHFSSLAKDVSNLAGPSLIAVDQELAGIQRLHHLTPSLPRLDDLLTMTDFEIEQQSEDVARAAAALGVNMFLSPIADLVRGNNVWLKGRTLGTDQRQISRICSAFIRGVERAGVITMPKHFPGHHDITCDPAIDMGVVTGDQHDLQPGYGIFNEVFAANPSACMLGPALVPAVDPVEPSSTSAKTVRMLRDTFRFKGMIVSDDLDGKAALAGRTIEQTAIASMRAGTDLLLVAAGPQIHSIAASLSSMAQSDEFFLNRLNSAAAVVRQLASLKRAD
jgi:beta-N-acetylhexosaminidase